MRLHRAGAAALAVLTAAAGLSARQGDQARAQVGLGLAQSYDVQVIDSPAPGVNLNFGDGIVSAGDITGDGKHDLFVPQLREEGKVFAFNGATGALLYTLTPPETAPAVGRQTNFGRMISRMSDIGSCPGHLTANASQLCALPAIGPKDGSAELLVGAPHVDIGGTDIGRAYLFDGASGALLKKIAMPPADVASEAVVAASLRGFPFGRSVLNPASPHSADPAVQKGDMNGGGEPDFAVGNSTFFESGPATNPACDPGPCAGSGRVYLYEGEDIVGSDPEVVLDAPYKVVKNPMSQTDQSADPVNHDSEFFGHSLFPIGDVGQCKTAGIEPGALCSRVDSSGERDQRADIVIGAPRTDWPVEFIDAGVAWLVDGPTGAVLTRYDSPDPQKGTLFGFSLTGGEAIGDSGNTDHPDVLIASIMHSHDKVSDGRAWIMNGNPDTGPSTIVIGQLDDPTPAQGGNFGSPASGIGNVAGPDPRGEVIVGGLGPFIPGDDTTIINDVHVMSPLTGQTLATLDDPDQQPGSAFGSGVAPMGDLNDDGLMDFAVGAVFWSSDALSRAGRVYIFRSTTEPVEVERAVSLQLRKHLRAKGAVTAAEPACFDSVPVVIKRNGSKVKSTTTAPDGTYSVRLKDRPGRYQAIAKQVGIDGGTCLKAVSEVKRHKH